MLHMPPDIPLTIFYGSIFSEPFYIARSNLRINDFILRKSDLFSKMVPQRGTRPKH